eukprot:5882346-Pleurochrysis_carterae.AAC.3
MAQAAFVRTACQLQPFALHKGSAHAPRRSATTRTLVFGRAAAARSEQILLSVRLKLCWPLVGELTAGALTPGERVEGKRACRAAPLAAADTASRCRGRPE